MGHVEHHAIVVTGAPILFLKGYEDRDIRVAHAKAESIFEVVGPLIKSNENGYCTFLIPPDGSKSGFVEDEAGDQQRTDFIDWADSTRDAEGNLLFDWIEVCYGADREWPTFVRHSDEPFRQWTAERRHLATPKGA